METYHTSTLQQHSEKHKPEHTHKIDRRGIIELADIKFWAKKIEYPNLKIKKGKKKKKEYKTPEKDREAQKRYYKKRSQTKEYKQKIKDIKEYLRKKNEYQKKIKPEELLQTIGYYNE